MAEAILKSKKLPNVNVHSAGVYAQEGGEMSVNARKNCTGEKIEISMFSPSKGGRFTMGGFSFNDDACS